MNEANEEHGGANHGNEEGVDENVDARGPHDLRRREVVEGRRDELDETQVHHHSTWRLAHRRVDPVRKQDPLEWDHAENVKPKKTPDVILVRAPIHELLRLRDEKHLEDDVDHEEHRADRCRDDGAGDDLVQILAGGVGVDEQGDEPEVGGPEHHDHVPECDREGIGGAGAAEMRQHRREDRPDASCETTWFFVIVIFVVVVLTVCK